MQDKKQLFYDTIQRAELVLIGIGKEFVGFDEKAKIAFAVLEKLLQNKNYFVVTTNMDGEICKSNLDQTRIVEPCGNYYNLQCGKGCHDTIYPLTELQQQEIRTNLMEIGQAPQRENATCPKCANPLTYNIVTEENYVEAGYLPQWEKYTKWLQGTLNKNLCIVELGVGMDMPTVIRWPFEKIAYLNQKSTFFRIHSSLYQMEKRLSERGISIQENPILFLNMLQ